MARRFERRFLNERLLNARNCGKLAAEAKDLPSKIQYKRMQEAWLALAEEEDWLGSGPIKSVARGLAG
jgi:hypothetical protein